MGFTKNQYNGELAKNGAWIVFRFKLRAGGGGGFANKREGVGGWGLKFWGCGGGGGGGGGASQIRGRCFGGGS